MSYEQKTIKVNGNEYKLQRMALKQYLRLKDQSSINGVLQDEKFSEGLLENVLIEPKMTLESFDEGDRLKDFAVVVKEIIAFQQPQ
ncbi:hypothetical protein LNN31_13585 [Acetobacterium wieringae]|uniref:Phage protein n=1 Tax=Acetobacterium wieringae TaxID=52694 RepID=A0ABY6HBB9_9FIRM|nr:hypothetical protein [Acetobacterium wieringae]UYO61808.1 hypothetical protein LNN31_13585 [Acetobacterium wieringae]